MCHTIARHNVQRQLRSEVYVFDVPDSAISYGFSNEPAGTHGSRTIMLSELRMLLDSCPPNSSYADYQQAIIYDNVLGKQTVTTRRESVRRLRELYSLSGEVLIFEALRNLWPNDHEAQPMLALLCAVARDPILRATADLIMETVPGDPVTPQMISAATEDAFPDRYNPTMLANVGRHAASSWQQSGHLAGRLHKTRSRAESHPESLAYALLLARLTGSSGDNLFTSFWCRLLDTNPATLRDQAAAAARLGWIDYLSAGQVTDVGFSHLLRGVDLA
jgi:hypothetical protein